MIQVLEGLPRGMADRLMRGRALILVTLLLFSSWASMLDWSQESQGHVAVFEDSQPSHSGAGESTDLTLSSSPNTNLKLDLPSDEPLTSAELNLKPKILPTQSGFVWDDGSDWTHSDAIINGTVVSSGALTGTSAGNLWDFNTNNQGWTFSNSYSARVTTPTCGINGTSGGSLRTYAGSTYATSPVINLAGGANIPFHAWVTEGSSGCGETPDSGENLQFQYKQSSGSWTTFKTFSGGGTRTLNFQYMTTLPAAALHTNSQFRIHQTSGSSTCCDYWFVDDVHIASPPESNWTSPTLGHAAGSTQLLSSDTYAPVHIEATVPTNAYLNWSVLDTAGQVIPGMHGSNTFMIPLQMLDTDVYDQVRIHLEFNSGGTNMPLVHSLAGDGILHESFHSNPYLRGWTGYNDQAPNSAWRPAPFADVTLGAWGHLTSPWYLASAPVYDAELSGIVTNAQVQVRHQPDDAWVNITLPYQPQASPEFVGMQVKIVPLPPADGNMSNFTTWTVEELNLEMFGGQYPTQPGLDFNLDERLEWGGSDARVGAWGWQDRFANSLDEVELSVTSGAPTVTKVWVPRSEMNAFSFSYLASSGSVQEIALIVQGDLIANRTYDGATNGGFNLNASEFSAFTTRVASVATAVNMLGTDFTEVSLEVSGQGTVLLGGLNVPYNGSYNLVADSDSDFVMGVNQARTSIPDIGGMQAIPLPFIATERGGLTVEIVSLQTSSTVILQNGAMRDAPSVLTPSQNWQTVETEYQVIGSNVVQHRLDVISKDNHATWLFPMSGANPVGLGDFEMVELHPDRPIEAVEDGMTVTANITFRLRPIWDDSMQVTVTSRTVLQNSVVAIPFSYTWGSISQQGYENDLELKSIDFSDASGPMASNRQYLRGGEQMNISVKVGFEGITSNDAFVDGDAKLTLSRGGTEIMNTTSLDANYWNFTETIPFTYGDVTWTIGLQSLNGSDIIVPAEISRTFTVDSVKPRVLSSSVERYDHRTPSPTQVLQMTVTDQPVLPTNLSAMVWKEWVDDANLNGWPDEGEFSSESLLLPSDLTALTGVYTLMLDDTAASLGQKVAVYIEGTDPSGYSIVDGGSSVEGEQLFVYQLAIDGAPTLEPDAFAWQDGRKSWLHPAQPYELDIKISEPNGGSDLATVEVMLAHNQGSDTMSILWDFNTGNCTTQSIHIIISDCEMIGENGPADPFEKDMLLNIEMHFGWNTPDLGDNRREPAIRVVDRAGQEEMKNFPEHRWRFSAGLAVPEETVNLYLTSGSFLGDGARVTPLTQMEVSGALEFAETHTIPNFDCDVDVFFAGQTVHANAINGIWSAELQAPVVSGSFSLTWAVGCLEGQGIDLTDKENSVRWIRVDGTGPEPIEVLSPRPTAILGGEEQEVRVVLEELGGLDVQSLELVWRVEDFETGDTLRSGRVPMNLDGNEIDGNHLEVYAVMDLTEVTDEMMLDRMTVSIRIDGRDLAGNEVLSLGGEPAGIMISTWNMEWLQPQFELSPSSVSYSRFLIDVGETTSVQLEVANTGSLEGSIDVLFESVDLEGNREVIQRTSVTAEAGGIGLVTLDWGPTKPGVQWVVATLDNGVTSSGPTVDVRTAEEPSFGEKVFGDVNPVIGVITGILFLSIIVTLLVMMKRMTVNQGSKISYDWDEYSSEFDEYDDYEDDEDDYDDKNSGTAAAGTTQESGEEETDWVKGADGYWWYHDKATNEWWYKDANGEIVKHP